MTSATPSTNSTNSEPEIAIIATLIPVLFLGIVAIIVGIILIPLIIRNNRRKMLYSTSNQDISEQPSNTAGGILEGGQSTTNTINSSGPSQTVPGEETEIPANHLYDDLINYTSQASHIDSECSQINHKTSAEADISVTKKTVGPTKDEDNSGTHTYAVLEEAVPPVPERTYRLNTNAKKRSEKKEHNCAIGHPSQNNNLNDKANNSPSYDDIAHHPKDREKVKDLPQHTLTTSDSDGHRDVLNDKREVDSVDSPNNHTYAILEGPVQVTPFQRQKTKSVGVRKIQSPTVAKRLSDTPHVYDTLIEKVKHITVSTRADEDPSVHQYAVLEGPTPPLGPHSDHRTKQVRKDSIKLIMNESTATGYDKLPPKDMDNINRLQKDEESLSAVINKTTTLTAGYDRLDLKIETMAVGNQVDMGHTYATLTPEEESVKSKKGKKKSKKKQKQKQTPNQTDNSHIYDVLDPQSEINSCVVRNEHEMLPPVPPRASMASSSNSSSRSHSISAPHKRKISHSFSSRMLSDVNEGRKRSLTVFTAASDTNLHRINPDAEAHIYDTVEVSSPFPVSKRKQRRSGKRYRWLHLKERLQRQSSLEILGSPTDTDLTSSHVIKTDSKLAKGPLTQSASLGNIVSEAVDSKLEPSNNYALLDMRQVYAQVGPYLPGKEDNEQYTEPDNGKDSEYSHLQHH